MGALILRYRILATLTHHRFAQTHDAIARWHQQRMFALSRDVLRDAGKREMRARARAR